ncbi:FAD-dependent monooxygenase [Streptomyces sp900116325]|uniref:FAD-dependent monooxygenase n=1 Tax=Streptomyces sp. 900116325 TaxID=3154295 RepID=A0ABV2UM54_9ACTN
MRCAVTPGRADASLAGHVVRRGSAEEAVIAGRHSFDGCLACVGEAVHLPIPMTGYGFNMSLQDAEAEGSRPGQAEQV